MAKVKHLKRTGERLIVWRNGRACGNFRYPPTLAQFGGRDL